MEQRLDQTKLLAVAARELAYPPVEIGLEPLRQYGPRPQAAHPARIGAELQGLASGDPRIARKVPGRLPSRARILRLAKWLSSPKISARPLVG